MRSYSRRSAAALLLLVLCGGGAHTPARAAVAQDIDAAAWLAGRWTGQGLGGEVEESWSPPAGGQMVGYFRLLRNGAVQFYELALLDAPRDGGVRMRVKHFNGDFVGWEEKGAWQTFEPAAASRDELRFDGLTLRRRGRDGLEIVLSVKDKTGQHLETLHLRHAGSSADGR